MTKVIKYTDEPIDEKALDKFPASKKGKKDNKKKKKPIYKTTMELGGK